MFWTCFEAIFPVNSIAQYTKEGRDLENFQEESKAFQISKIPRQRSQNA